MARTVADAFNQYHQQYVKPQMNARLTSSAAAATYATQASLATRATLDSPHFTGTPTAPTAGNDTDSTQIATTEFCQNLIRRLCGVDTKTIALLADLADALLNQPDFREAVVTVLDNKLDKSDAAATYMKKTDSIDTSNLAKLNASNTFTQNITIQKSTTENATLILNNSARTGKVSLYSNHLRIETSGSTLYLDDDVLSLKLSPSNAYYKFKADGIYIGDTKITN